MSTAIRKVMVVNKYHFMSGGAERYFFTIMNALRERGIECVPFSVRYAPTVETPYEKYFIPPVVKDSEAKMRHQKPSAVQACRLGLRALYSFEAYRGAKKLIEAERPDIAYLLNINNHLSPSVISACVGAGVPVVMRMSDFNLACASNMYFRDGVPCTECRESLFSAVRHRCVHGSSVRSAVGAFAIGLHRALGIYRKVGAFVAPTEFMREDLRRLGFDPQILHQINTPVRSQETEEPERENPYVIYAGRFVGCKGVDMAVEAFAQAAPDGVKLRLVGDEGDEDAARIRSVIDRCGARNVVLEPFERDRAKLVSKLRRALFAIAPSQFYENLPNAILEAFACGRPVLATDLGSLPDVVHAGKNGLLFAPGDGADFAAKIKQMASDVPSCNQMGTYAREEIMRDYSEDGHCERLLDVFSETIERRQAVRGSR